MRRGTIDLPPVDSHFPEEVRLGSPEKRPDGYNGRASNTLLLGGLAGSLKAAEFSHVQLLQLDAERLSQRSKSATICHHRAAVMASTSSRLISSALKASSRTSMLLLEEDLKELARVFCLVDSLLEALKQNHDIAVRNMEIYQLFCRSADIAFKLLTLERPYARTKKSIYDSYEEACKRDSEEFRTLGLVGKDQMDMIFERGLVSKTLVEMLRGVLEECAVPHRALLKHEVVGLMREMGDEWLVDTFFAT